MAFKIYSSGALPTPDRYTLLLFFRDSILDRYPGASVAYMSSDNLKCVLSTPAISDRLIRLELPSSTNGNATLAISLGRDLQSDGSITVDSVVFGGNLTNYSGQSITLYLGDCSCLIICASAYDDNAYNAIIGKMTNGDYISISVGLSTRFTGHGSNLSKGYAAMIDSFNETSTLGGKLLKRPLYIVDAGGGIPVNADGSPAYMEGYYSVSLLLPIRGSLGGPGFIIPQGLYTNRVRPVRSNFMLEY